MRRLWALCGLASACFTPVGEPCHGVTCLFDGGGGVACSVGSTQQCGSSVGECKPGRQECQTNGQWGQCEGGVMPGVEVCDGKDNNCDGQIDEGVKQVCPLQKGVCAGAAASCGGDGGCLVAYGTSYEPIELSCDGLDNDCDGVVDRSAAVNVSQSPGVVSRKPSAVRVPGTQTALVLYEEGQKIAARVVNADGSLSPTVSPSVTVDAVVHAWAPAVATGSTLIVAAWAEDTGAAKRVMVASLDATTGKSTLTGGGALFALSVTDPTEVAVAVDEGAGQLVIAVVDNGTLNVVGFSSTLPPPMGSPSFTDVPYEFDSEHPTLASMGGGNFLLGCDHATSGKAVRTAINVSGTGPADATQPTGSDVSVFFPDAGSADSFFLSGQEVVRSACSVSAMSLTCDAPATVFTTTGADALRLAYPVFAAWQQGTSAPEVMGAVLAASAAVSMGPGRRPWPVLTTKNVITFFDTESLTSTLATDDVYFIRSCR